MNYIAVSDRHLPRIFSPEKPAGLVGVQEQEQTEPGPEQRQPAGRLQGPRLRAGGHRGAQAMAGAGNPRKAVALPSGRVRALPVRLDARGADGIAGSLFDGIVADPCSGGGGREHCGAGAERALWHVHKHDADETGGLRGSSGGAVLILAAHADELTTDCRRS